MFTSKICPILVVLPQMGRIYGLLERQCTIFGGVYSNKKLA